MNNLDLNKRNLLQSLKNGDEAAFEEIFYLYQKKLYCFIFTITKSKYVTEEILQEVFIKLWSIRETINISMSFDSFIYTITRNLTYNYIREIGNRNSLKQELWKNVCYFHEQTENDIFYKEYKNIVDGIVDKLPIQKKSIFILSKEEGKSNQEIADLLGIAPKTVKNHLWKTLQIIRLQLQPYIKTITAALLLINLF